MRNQDKQRLSVLRFITASLKQQEIDRKIELDDDAVMSVLEKIAKQMRDATQQFKNAGRDDLVAKETFELSVVQEYLPPALSDEEINRIITESIAESKAKSIKDMGKVMGILRPRVQHRADLAKISKLVKQLL